MDQGPLLLAVHVQRLRQWIDDPVFLHALAAVEGQFDLTVPPLIGPARREDFDHQLRRPRQMPGLVEGPL